uniref:C-C motif chemokine n=2 Tax=Salmo trutta TaxID=8032 RepID=A0A674D655_SALTR
MTLLSGGNPARALLKEHKLPVRNTLDLSLTHYCGTHLKIRMLRCRVCVLAVLLSLLTLIPSTQSAHCCLKYTRRPLQCRRLKNYTHQPITSSCDIHAVIFQTWMDKFVCADPSQDWTKRVHRCLLKRQENKSKLKKTL